MSNITAVKNKKQKLGAKAASGAALLKSLLLEIRMLRNEIALLFPLEDVNEYTHATRIKKSYAKAVGKYPPLAVWK